MKITNPFGVDVFELVLWLVEFSPYVIGSYVALVCYTLTSVGGPGLSPKKSAVHSTRLACASLLLPGLILGLVGSVIVGSWEDAYVRGYDIFHRPSLRAKLEEYIETGESDLTHVLESGKYAPTFGLHEVGYLMRDLLRHTVLHSDEHNEGNIDEGYKWVLNYTLLLINALQIISHRLNFSKGNDWFKATLGSSMMYTTGLYKTGKETLEEAQDYKIDYVADAIQLEPGMTVLDIGSGWGYLTNRLTEKYGANVTGITLSREQLAYATELNENNGAKIHLQDAMQIKERDDLPRDGFDRITSLEMAEHVGIRRYQEFLGLVHDMLKDDGVFYFQVAGLRRAWRYEGGFPRVQRGSS